MLKNKISINLIGLNICLIENRTKENR